MKSIYTIPRKSIQSTKKHQNLCPPPQNHRGRHKKRTQVQNVREIHRATG